MLKIGITGSIDSERNHNLRKEYIDAINSIGHIPYIIPCTGNGNVTEELVSLSDCIVLTGGYDIDPSEYGEKVLYKLGIVIPERDKFDFKVIEAAILYNKPLFGICRGLQCINVFFGGTLFQDIPSQSEPLVCNHDQMEPTEFLSHSVNISESSRLFLLTGSDCIRVNSHHHQAVKDLGEGLVISGCAEDGIIESVESSVLDIIAVQFHPERMVANDAPGLKLLSNWANSVEKTSKIR